MAFKERLSKYYGVSKDGKYVNPDTLNNYITDISGYNKFYLDCISEELSEDGFVKFVMVLFPSLSDMQLIEDIDPNDLIAKNGYVAGARLLRLQDTDLGLKESIITAKRIEKELNTLNNMVLSISYAGDVDDTTAFGIASYEVKMYNGDIIKFDFMDVSTFIHNAVVIISCETLDTESFPESKDIDINEILEITNIEFEDDGDYAHIEKINGITLYSNGGEKIFLEPCQLVTINDKLAAK